MEHFYKESITSGLFNKGTQYLYQKAVDEADNNFHFVEVGAGAGASTAFMIVEILNSNKKIKFDVVDHWKGTPEEYIWENIKDLKSEFYSLMTKHDVLKHITVYDNTSINASKNYEDNSLDFVYIDANHSYEFVKADIEAWLPKVKNGGVLAGDDYHMSGVGKAVDELIPNINKVYHSWYTIIIKKPKISIVRMYRGFNKFLYFTVLQAKDKFREYDVKFYALIDDVNGDEYKERILNSVDMIVYNKDDVKDLCIDYGLSSEEISAFENYPWVYNLYLDLLVLRDYNLDYIVHYDDDIVIDAPYDDLNEIKTYINNKQPFSLKENSYGSNLSLLPALSNFYNKNLVRQFLRVNRSTNTLNCGFMGVNLGLYKDFIKSKENFKILYNMFVFESPFPVTEDFTFLFTQEQSFHILVNFCIHSKPVVVKENGYYDSKNTKIKHYFGTHCENKNHIMMVDSKIKDYENKSTLLYKPFTLSDIMRKL